MSEYERIWSVVKACSEASSAQWPRILEQARLPPEAETRVRAMLAEMDSLSEEPLVAEKIGPYLVRRKLAEGGMGIVYEAEQESTGRTVALKVLKSAQTTLLSLKRFEHEARALARLNHPNIAQIYEAGVATMPFGNLHYFTMEFVDGLSLLEHAARADLGLTARLELMRQICDAVEHAHSVGIIHRDLKPSNILVSAGGQPKVLDFGVASLALTGNATTQYTAAGELLGTLAYMSPEQVREGSLAADQRTDVYALGVLLYELVCGQPPYDTSQLPLPQAALVICEQEPESLTARNRAIPLDVAVVTAKALEKDKERRYQTVAALREDLTRFLSLRPILAKPPTQRDQLVKFARRNRTLVASLAAILFVLAAATSVSTWQALRARAAERQAVQERDRTLVAERSAVSARDAALRSERQAAAERDRAVAAEQNIRRERQRADQEAAAATAISDFLQNDLLMQASPEMQGGASIKPDPDMKVRTALDRAAARIGTQFAQQPAVEASLRQTIGNTYLRLGLIPEARTHMERAFELRRRVLGEEHLDTLRTMHNLAWLLQERKEYAAAEPVQERILAIRRKLLGERHPDTMRAMNNLAGSYLGQLKIDKARPVLERLVATMTAERGAEDPATLVAMNNLAIVSYRLGQFAAAEQNHRRVLEIRRRKLGELHPDTLTSLNNAAAAVYAQGRWAEAESLSSQTVAGRRKVLGENHPSTLGSMTNLALIYEAQRRFDKAADLHGQVQELRRAALGEAHSDTLESLESLARVRLMQGDYAACERLARRALAARATAKIWQRYYAQALTGQSLAAQQRLADAEPLLREAYEGMRTMANAIPLWQRPLSLGLVQQWVEQLDQAKVRALR
jgi:eukaryotic-like serine/threonine-protein kinase